jgi:hypothetical protein
MKRILIIIIVTLAIILIPVYIFWQIDLKGKYDKHIKIEESFEPVLVNIATQDQLKKLELIKNNWEIIHDDNVILFQLRHLVVRRHRGYYAEAGRCGSPDHGPISGCRSSQLRLRIGSALTPHAADRATEPSPAHCLAHFLRP